jgi:hypothetical protein
MTKEENFRINSKVIHELIDEILKSHKDDFSGKNIERMNLTWCLTEEEYWEEDGFDTRHFQKKRKRILREKTND